MKVARRIPGIILCLSAVALAGPAPSLGTAAAAPRSQSAHHAAAASATNTLLAGHSLVAGTDHSRLAKGWYTLEVWSGTTEIDETIPVPGTDGISSSTTGTWMRQDPTGRFQAQHDHTRLRLTPNGDLALVTSHGRRLWHSATAGSGAVRLTLHRSGDLALYTESGTRVWSSHSGQVQMSGGMTLEPGQQLRDAWETAFRGGTTITLTMRRDGNLVHRCGRHIDWQTHTHIPGSTLRMHADGALQVVTPKGHRVWGSHSGGDHDYARLNGKHMWIDADGLELIWAAQLDYQVC